MNISKRKYMHLLSVWNVRYVKIENQQSAQSTAKNLAILKLFLFCKKYEEYVQIDDSWWCRFYASSALSILYPKMWEEMRERNALCLSPANWLERWRLSDCLSLPPISLHAATTYNKYSEANIGNVTLTETFWICNGKCSLTPKA